MTKYKFNGTGPGVPGLPHEISDEQVAQFNPGQRELLTAAIAAGTYIEIDAPKPARVSTKSKKSATSDEGEQA